MDGEEFILRPTFDALARIEDEISTGSVEVLLEETQRSKLSIKDAAIILTRLAEAGGNPIEQESLEEYFTENGTGWVRVFLMAEVLPKIVYGGKAYEEMMAQRVKEVADKVVDEEDTEKKDESPSETISQYQSEDSASSPPNSGI